MKPWTLFDSRVLYRSATRLPSVGFELGWVTDDWFGNHFPTRMFRVQQTITLSTEIR